MDVKKNLAELIQNYLQAATELHDYTASEGISTPCGFEPSDSIHMYCTPETYGSLAKLFDPGSSHVKPSTGESYYEFATIGGIPIKILWNAEEYEKICKMK